MARINEDDDLTKKTNKQTNKKQGDHDDALEIRLLSRFCIYIEKIKWNNCLVFKRIFKGRRFQYIFTYIVKTMINISKSSAKSLFFIQIENCHFTQQYHKNTKFYYEILYRSFATRHYLISFLKTVLSRNLSRCSSNLCVHL